jgi:hypothetical protein
VGLTRPTSFLESAKMDRKSSRSVIDHSGRLRIGKYKGELAFDISRSDPKYLRWMLDTVDGMDKSDAEMIEMLLNQARNAKK